MPPGAGMVAGAAGGGAPQKTVQTGVAGAAGGGAAAAPGAAATATAAGAGAVAGASALGGGAGDMASILATLTAAIQSLAALVQNMGSTAGGGGPATKAGGGCGDHAGGGHVMGVQGEAAKETQFVAPVAQAQVQRVASGEDDAFEAQVLKLINAERAKAGLAPVTYNATLDTAAEKHATHMSLAGKMAHDGIGDGDPGERIRAEGFRKSWGENVATGQTSPEQVVREWMNSPAHRRNIMDPNFRQMGVGYVTAANGRSYWAQEFGAA